MRINGWQRIGIVLSIAWMIGATIYERGRQMDSAQFLMQGGLRVCDMNREHSIYKCPEPPNHNECMANAYRVKNSCDEEVTRNYSENWLKPNWPNVAFLSIAPVFAGWIVAYLILQVFRWVKAGFHPKRLD